MTAVKIFICVRYLSVANFKSEQTAFSMALPEGGFVKDITRGDCDLSDALTPRFGTPGLQETLSIKGRDLLATIGLPQLIGLAALAGNTEFPSKQVTISTIEVRRNLLVMVIAFLISVYR